MSAKTYEKLRASIKRLNAAEQLKLLEELAALVRREMAHKPQRSILELRGLGKEIWQNIDAQRYVDQERDSWNG